MVVQKSKPQSYVHGFVKIVKKILLAHSVENLS